MTPRTLIETAENPDGMRLELLRRGPHFSIRSGGQPLMNSRVHDSEQALARLALEGLEQPASASVLICGLGFGFTLAETLARVGPSASVTVRSAAPVPMTRRVLRVGRAAMSLRRVAQRGPRKEAKIHDRLCDVGDE